MLRRFLVLLPLAFAPALAHAAEEKATFVTMAEVDALQKEVQSALAAKDCDAALPLLDRFAAGSNTLVNILNAGLGPNDRASQAGGRALGTDEIQAASRQVVYWERERNRAWISQAECYAEAGEREAAGGLYVRVLDVVSGEDRETYDKARLGLWGLAGIPR